MKTLVFRLEGPMQAWGHRSRFDNRDTGLEPSRSGVIGFLCAALGWGRDADLSPFQHLRMGVRVDRPGQVMMDFHTAQSVARASGGVQETVVSRRFYLSDACFTVGLEAGDPGDEAFLGKLEAALRTPRWPLYLGRRSFPLTAPPCPAEPTLYPEDLDTALRRRGFDRLNGARPQGPFDLWLETAFTPMGIVRNDVPLSLDSNDRRYGLRTIVHETATAEEGESCT